jgi:hypothetical protein
MKNLFLAILLMLSAGALAAQNPAGGGRSSAARQNSSASTELAAIEQFLNLSDDELAQMEQVIARLRAMTPAQRAALRAEIAAFRQLPEPQRQQIRQGWGRLPADLMDNWREMMQNATPERRAEISTRLQALAPEEKTNYRRELVEAYMKAKQPKP